jgi:hypothetical protein
MTNLYSSLNELAKSDKIELVEKFHRFDKLLRPPNLKAYPLEEARRLLRGSGKGEKLTERLLQCALIRTARISMPFSGGSLPKRSNEWKAMSNE